LHQTVSQGDIETVSGGECSMSPTEQTLYDALKRLISIASYKMEIPADIRAAIRTADEHEAEQRELDAYRRRAQQDAREGECEVDDNALVSKGDDDGAYVQAWVWVANDDL
jgi:superfamily II RNA helicase